MIIVEGTDLIGKTTMCRELLLHYPYVYRHFTKLPDSWRYPHDYKEHVAVKVVQDRFHMSHIAYQSAICGQYSLNKSSYADIDEWVAGVQGRTIILTAGEEFIRKQWRTHQRPEMFDLATILRANEIYVEILDGLASFPCAWDIHLHLDAPYTSTQFQGVLDELKELRA